MTNRTKPKKAVFFAGLVLFFCSTAWAQKAPPQIQPTPSPTPTPVYRFQVNPIVRIKNSTKQVLAGIKEANTAILINNRVVIPKNIYKTWYYEQPLSAQSDNKITVGMSFNSIKAASQTPLDLKKDGGGLDTAPVIISIRFDPQTKDIILTIKDPPGVLSYNIYFANNLAATGQTTPFTLAQSNYPVSGTGITTWRDNGTFTKVHPADPSVYMRFYKLEVAKIAGPALQITNITPADNSTFLAGSLINIKPDVSSSTNGALQYQFSVGGTIKQAWSSANSYNWYTYASDTGTVNITCEVKDAKNNRAARTITCRIINPTIEEILKKVADNYGKIYDLKADMIFSSTLDGKPLGTTEYCCYYFKAPNKERTDSFSDLTRANMTDENIINGSTMYLIDPLRGVTQSVDLLAQTGLNSGQFNQMDLYYNQTNFLNNHVIVKDDPNSDFNNATVAFDAIPKVQNGLYSKLELYIDFNKGVLLKICMYKKNEDSQQALVQTLEATATQQMPNGAWIPVKIKKTPNFTSGTLISTIAYVTPQVNIGLRDADFNPGKQYPSRNE